MCADEFGIYTNLVYFAYKLEIKMEWTKADGAQKRGVKTKLSLKFKNKIEKQNPTFDPFHLHFHSNFLDILDI